MFDDAQRQSGYSKDHVDVRTPGLHASSAAEAPGLFVLAGLLAGPRGRQGRPYEPVRYRSFRIRRWWSSWPATWNARPRTVAA